MSVLITLIIYHFSLHEYDDPFSTHSKSKMTNCWICKPKLNWKKGDFKCAHTCICRYACTCVQVCVDARGHPLPSFLRSHPPSFKTGFLAGKDLTKFSRLAGSLGIFQPHLSDTAIVRTHCHTQLLKTWLLEIKLRASHYKESDLPS